MGYLLPFYSPINPENQNFEKMKKTPGETIILHKYTLNYSHMIYVSWDINCNTDFFFVILGHSLPFYPLFPLTAQKIKKRLEISSFYLSVPKIMIIGYTVPEAWYMMDVIIIFHFGLFFALLLTNNPKNQNFEKIKKNTWRCHHFT